MQTLIWLRPKFLLLLLSVFSTFLFNSCKKEESFTEVPIKKENLAEKFFATKTAPTKEIASIIEQLKKENASSDFINKLPANIGLPVWDKVVLQKENDIIPTDGFGIYVGNSFSTADIILPLANTTTGLSGILMAHPTTNGYTIGSYTIDQLYSVCHGDKIDTARATRELVLFFYLENQVFGTTSFYHIPAKLFPKSTVLDTDGNKTITIKDKPSNTSSLLITSCVTVVCSWCRGNDPSCPNGGSWEECTTIYIPTGGGSIPWPNGPTGGPAGTGGGSNPTGGNGGTPPPCPGSVWYGFGEGPCPNLPPPLPPIISSLQSILGLNAAQTSWLQLNTSTAEIIYQSLFESLSDENPLTGQAYNNSYPAEAIAASKMTIAAVMNNYTSGPYNTAHYNLIKQNIPNYQSHPNLDPVFWAHFSLQCALIHLEHPEYNEIQIYYYATKELMHTGLDVIGLVPVIGEVADLANGIIYTLEGDGVNATLSFAATIPIAGWVATGTKYAKKAITALDGSTRTLKWLKQTNNIISFGDRGLLRKVLGLAKGDARVAHHLIPWEHGVSDIVQKAAGGDFHLNEILNGIPLTIIQHNGGHFLYNQKIGTKLQELWVAGGQSAMSVQTAQNLVRNLANDIKIWITNHPNETINNIILP
jgi:A nuclease family of the HNH/ENDO VII superfamily with conserved AHH